MDSGKARERVRKLRSLAAPGSGATEHERSTASRLADELTAKFRLDEPEPPVATFTAGGDEFVDISTAINDILAGNEALIRDILRGSTAAREARVRAKMKRFRDILSGGA